ncbi:MAG: hypothetical protein ACLR0U_22365 [Enterocloster clostridioformis]
MTWQKDDNIGEIPIEILKKKINPTIESGIHVDGLKHNRSFLEGLVNDFNHSVDKL